MSTSLIEIFVHYAPVRSNLLSMLLPFDIAKLLAAISCCLTPHERRRHMNVLDDIFSDPGILVLMHNAGLVVRVFGADLARFERRLLYPCRYLSQYRPSSTSNIFVLVTSRNNELDPVESLTRDYRSLSQRGEVPNTLTTPELIIAYGKSTAFEVATFSSWILCAPHLAGSLPRLVPGWIPVFNAQPFVNIRAYIATYDNHDSHILNMSSDLLCRLFDHVNYQQLVQHINQLSVTCYKFDGGKKTVHQMKGMLTKNILHEIVGGSQRVTESGLKPYVIANMVYPLNSCIIVEFD